MWLFIIVFILIACNSAPEGSNDSVENQEDVSVSYLYDGESYNRYGFNLDLLVVMDNTRSMECKQLQLQEDISKLLDEMKTNRDGGYNLHFGVVSTDVDYLCNYYNSEESNGRFIRGKECGVTGSVNYLVDIEPQGCEISRDQAGQCQQNSCSVANCRIEGEPENLFLLTDSDGCPRCRNFYTKSPQEAISCMVNVGSESCFWRQPLKAMKSALTQNHYKNQGFLRENSLFGVLFFTDGPDCSANQKDFYDDSYPGGIDDAPFSHDLSCLVKSIDCDEGIQKRFASLSDGDTTTFINCDLREDEDPLMRLISVRSFHDYLIDDPEGPQLEPVQVVPGVLAGDNDRIKVEFDTDSRNQYKLVPSCTKGDSTCSALPDLRVSKFVEMFYGNYQVQQKMSGSICSLDYREYLTTLAEKFNDRFSAANCPTLPLAGCENPLAALFFEVPDEVCQPECKFYAVINEDSKSLLSIPPCPDDYKDGNPPAIDPDLPVEQCYQTIYDSDCRKDMDGGNSKGARIIISSRTRLEHQKIQIECKAKKTP
ncbi:MAG: hypothetical protein ACQES9_06120 [Myxococcota bacterium]